MTEASLSLNVKSDGVSKASKRLAGLTGAAAQAQKASVGFTSSQTGAATAASRLGASATGAAAATSRFGVSATGAGVAASRLGVFATGAATAASRLAASTVAAAVGASRMAVSALGAATSSKALTGAAASATVAANGLTASVARLVAPLAAILGPLLLMQKVFSSTVELQDFEAQLKTATGSVENAGVAFEALEEFASSTPYALEQSLEGFIKLVNLGLTPSERALKSYGNTASAMGKDLTQLVEAVADATTGEFERLKEFGIKAKSEGDRVSFTFRGVTTEIGKNAAEIESYLMRIGENEFAGAMSDRMATVGGLVSNFGDTWDKVFRTISEMGAGEIIGQGLQEGIDLMEELIALLESGQFEAGLDSWTESFKAWSDDFEALVGYVGDIFKNETDLMAEGGDAVFDNWILSLKTLPAQFEYWMKRLGVEIGAIVGYGTAAGEGLKSAIVASFEGMLASAKNYGQAIGSALNPFDGKDFTQAIQEGVVRQAEIYAEGLDSISKSWDAAMASTNNTREARIELLGEIDDELGATIKRTSDLTDLSDGLRRTYEEEKAARDAARGGEDRLAQFKITPEGGATPASAKDKKKKKGRGKSASSIPDLFDPFGASNELEYLDQQVDRIRDSYEKRKAAILEITDATESEKNEMLRQSQDEYMRILEVADQERNSMRLGLASEFFGNLGQMASAFGEKGAKVAKAAAIAQTTIKTYESATSAYAALAGIPIVGPALGAAAAGAAIAAGVANISAIQSTPVNVGRYAGGGIIGGSSHTGDSLVANVNSGEMILNRTQQSRLLDIADRKQRGQGEGSSAPIVNVYPLPGETAEVRQNPDDPRQIEIILKRVDQKLTSDLQTGGGKFVPALTKRIPDLKKA